MVIILEKVLISVGVALVGIFFQIKTASDATKKGTDTKVIISGAGVNLSGIYMCACRDACGTMVIILGNGHGEPSSNPGGVCMDFT